MSVFLVRFKANYLARRCATTNFSLLIPIALAKIYLFCVVSTWRKKPLHLVSTVLNIIASVIIFLLGDNFYSALKVGCPPGW